MARIEYPVWTVARSALAMPFRYPLALVRFGLLPLLIATVCLPPPLNIGQTTTTTVDGVDTGAITDMFSTTDNELGLRDLVGFLLMLPFAAAFAAAWNRLTATGDATTMGRAPIAFDARTVGVIWGFIRLACVALGMGLLVVVALFLIFGKYQDGQLSFNISYTTEVDGLGPTLAMIAAMLLVTLAFAWFVLRFALIIPAAAMANPISLKESWRLSAPVQFRLFGAALVATAGFFIVYLLMSLVLALLFGALGARGTFYVAVVLYFPVLVYAHAVWAGLLGASYGLLQPAHFAAEAKAFD
ncbi:hypothetical protein [Dongia sp.]|uniref:hypothetical protein n=1 Tax=Dongia sp. TaxID=1977262 RepID=UPI003753DBAF